jgi:hypothetical protein
MLNIICFAPARHLCKTLWGLGFMTGQDGMTGVFREIISALFTVFSGQILSLVVRIKSQAAVCHLCHAFLDSWNVS